MSPDFNKFRFGKLWGVRSFHNRKNLSKKGTTRVTMKKGAVGNKNLEEKGRYGDEKRHSLSQDRKRLHWGEEQNGMLNVIRRKSKKGRRHPKSTSQHEV